MERYTSFTQVKDQGPYITGLILHLDRQIRSTELPLDCFNVYTERRDPETGELLPLPGSVWQTLPPSKGYRRVLDAWPCSPDGRRQSGGRDIFLKLSEEPLGKRTQGSVLESKYITCYHRVTQLLPIPAGEPGDPPLVGLVFDECDGDLCPQTAGWAVELMKASGEGLPEALGYAYFTPEHTVTGNIFEPYKPVGPGDKLPLVIWLHGAGEGGRDPWLAVTGNKVVNLSSDELQRKLGGAAWVLAPQCPSFWMDDGGGKIAHTSRSIYGTLLMACIRGFIAAHRDSIDEDRVYIGGDSNGGFMTVRMAVDYPGVFAAAFPACQAFFSANMSDAELQNLVGLPLWFIHCRQDELIPPRETTLPIYYRLLAAGAKNVHLTYLDHMEDLTGEYRDEQGRPRRLFNHSVWIHVYNDQVDTELDGTKVLVDGEPATLFEWLGVQKRKKDA